MQHRMAKLGVASVSVLAATFTFAAAPALADIAPQQGDVVGVGSDTLQYAADFAADGSYTGSAGYNSALNHYRVFNFDATPDANARLAYGPGGASGTTVGTTSGYCAPGDSTDSGTGNQTSPHKGALPCTLNPTIVLKAGTKPIQRPNGSGAGAKALAGDTVNNGTTFGSDEITYARASSCQDSSGATGCSGVLSTSAYDVLKIGTDPLAILTASTTNAPNLSTAELKLIYNCTDTTWASLPNAPTGASTDTIYAIIPQVGSGTRSTFEGDIGLSDSTLGSCVHVAEENDPTAIDASGVPADAIEPMSGARLNLFNGVNGSTGASYHDGGYFLDPSCALVASGAYGSASNSDGVASECAGTPGTLPPAISTSDVTLNTTQGATSDGSTAYLDNRGLYIYFRSAQVDTNVGWQPGSVDNAIRTLFYNPCDAYAQANIGTGSCVTVGSTMYGPGGQPYYAKTAGQADIAAAGINPAYEVSTTGVAGL